MVGPGIGRCQKSSRMPCNPGGRFHHHRAVLADVDVVHGVDHVGVGRRHQRLGVEPLLPDRQNVVARAEDFLRTELHAERVDQRQRPEIRLRRTLVTTPNSDVIYAMNYIDVGRDGPMVMEAPPGLQGILLDFWQRPIPGPTIEGHEFAGDVGLPGPDSGKGGKFLTCHRVRQAGTEGYFVYRSETNNVFVFLRSFYQDPKNLAPAVAVMEAVKIYPLEADANAKPMQYPERRECLRTCCLSPMVARSTAQVAGRHRGCTPADPD